MPSAQEVRDIYFAKYYGRGEWLAGGKNENGHVGKKNEKEGIKNA